MSFDLYSIVTKTFLDELVRDNKKPQAIARYTKNLSLSEVRLISSYGIDIISTYEAQGNLYSSYTTAFGLHDGNRAVAEVRAIGQPINTFIYVCAADFDATMIQISNGIKDYFVALNKVLSGTGYKIGCYGNGAVCKYLLDNKLADKAWLWGVYMSNGTDEFFKSNRWSIHQHVTSHIYGVGVDMDDLNGEYGGWQYGKVYDAVIGDMPFKSSVEVTQKSEPVSATPIAATTIPPITAPLQATTSLSKADTVREIQLALQGFKLYTGALDGIWGSQTQRAIDKLRSM